MLHENPSCLPSDPTAKLAASFVPPAMNSKNPFPHRILHQRPRTCPSKSDAGTENYGTRLLTPHTPQCRNTSPQSKPRSVGFRTSSLALQFTSHPTLPVRNANLQPHIPGTSSPFGEATIPFSGNWRVHRTMSKRNSTRLARLRGFD